MRTVILREAVSSFRGLGHHTDSGPIGPIGIGQYNSLREYVALILPPLCLLY